MTSAAVTSRRTTPEAPGTPAPARTAAADPAGAIAAGRARIDELDAQIVALVQQRLAVSRDIQHARLAAGGRRVEHGREVEVVNRYAASLGRPGAELALALLALARGAVGAGPEAAPAAPRQARGGDPS